MIVSRSRGIFPSNPKDNGNICGVDVSISKQMVPFSLGSNGSNNNLSIWVAKQFAMIKDMIAGIAAQKGRWTDRHYRLMAIIDWKVTVMERIRNVAMKGNQAQEK